MIVLEPGRKKGGHNDRHHAPQRGRTNAERDKHPHVWRAISDRGDAALDEWRTRIEYDWQSKHQLEPLTQMRRYQVIERHADVRGHRNDDQWHCERDCHD